jgi:hypothetical protein
MKKTLDFRPLTLGILILATCHLPPATCGAATNVYLEITGAELNRRLGVVTNLEVRLPPVEASVTNLEASVTNLKTAVLSAGLADIGFVNQTISAAFTNANFGTFDLSPYVGTNEALVVLRVLAIAASTVSIRTPGDTNNVDATSMNGVAIGAGETAAMIVKTGPTGLIDVKATANTALSLTAFIRRHVFE